MRVPTHAGTEPVGDQNDDGESNEHRQELKLGSEEKLFGSTKVEKGAVAIRSSVYGFLLRRRIDAVGGDGGGVSNRNEGGHGSRCIRDMLRLVRDVEVDSRRHVSMDWRW